MSTATVTTEPHTETPDDALRTGGEVWVQSGQAVMSLRTPEEAKANPWPYLVGYDFADEGEDGPDWLPGHA